MSVLDELNQRWQVTGKPHAVSVNPQLYRMYCPRCGQNGHTALPLHAAMSDALVHKKRCVLWKDDSGAVG